jgi:phage-related protein
MIPILYDAGETAFISNGLGRLRDTIKAEVTEERNNVYELEFEYPVSGLLYDELICGRIVGVKHDDTGDIQPFEIYSYSKPISGIVTFNAQHISYKQSKMTVTNGTAINNINDAFTLLTGAKPSNPFSYWTDIVSTAYMSGAEGAPKTVRQLLGGVEGSILDAY